jgi:hypothetical protein
MSSHSYLARDMQFAATDRKVASKRHESDKYIRCLLALEAHMEKGLPLTYAQLAADAGLQLGAVLHILARFPRLCDILAQYRRIMSPDYCKKYRPVVSAVAYISDAPSIQPYSDFLLFYELT